MKFVVAMFAAGLLLAGCSGSDSAGSPKASPTESSQAEEMKKAQDELEDEVARKAAEAQGTVVKIAIKDGKATPQGDRVEVKVGDKVTFEMISDAAEEIHVHSDPEHSYELAPGEQVTESFTLKRPGQVAVEAHHLGVTIVQLVVRP